MVRESVNLLELLRKQASDGDLDFLREAVAVLADAVMDAEVSAQIGAGYGERSEERTTRRNGYRAWLSKPGGSAARGSSPPSVPRPVHQAAGPRRSVRPPQGDAVDAGCAAIAAHLPPRALQNVPAVDLVIERMKASSGLGLGRPVERAL